MHNFFLLDLFRIGFLWGDITQSICILKEKICLICALSWRIMGGSGR